MYDYHPKNTCVPETLRVSAFIAGCTGLFEAVSESPNLRMVDIKYVDGVRSGLKHLGFRVRIRYRGPHGRQRDTHKQDARAFTVYFQ